MGANYVPVDGELIEIWAESGPRIWTPSDTLEFVRYIRRMAAEIRDLRRQVKLTDMACDEMLTEREPQDPRDVPIADESEVAL